MPVEKASNSKFEKRMKSMVWNTKGCCRVRRDGTMPVVCFRSKKYQATHKFGTW